jgi:sugar lactone lactonase YvrE
MGVRNNVLWEFDLTDPKAGGRPPQKLWDETGGLNSFVVRDNTIVGPQGDTGAIIRFDLATHEVKTIASGLKWPTAVKTDAKGQLYAVDLEAGTVHRIDAEKGAAPVIATLEPGLDNFSVGANGKLYISSITRNGIFEIDPATGAERTITRGHLTAPGGVAVAGSGETARVYVADMFTLRAVHPRTGAVETVIPMSREGIYPGAVSAHAGPNGDHLILTSWFVGRLEVRDRLSGAVVRTEKDLSAPRDALELDDGSLLVAETGAHRLLRIHADGSRSALPAAFADPVGLARAGDSVFVTDAWSGTLSRVDVRSGQASLVANGFGRPEGVAVRPDGKVLVVDSLKQTVVAVDPATGTQSVVATVVPVGLEGPPPQNPAWIHNGVAVTGDGMVYVSSDTRAALYAFSPRR